MRDTVSIARVNILHPKWKNDVTSFIEDCEEGLNISLRIDQGLRTFEEQYEIYALGRTKPGAIVTHSNAGQSYHNYGLAIDVVPLIMGKPVWNFNYEKLRVYANKYGIQLGKDFPAPDYDHFENKYGLNWREMLKRYNEKDFIVDTNYINI